MSTKKNYRRRKYFIEKRIQGRFILLFCAVSLVGGLLAMALFAWLGGHRLDGILYAMRLPTGSAATLLWRELVAVNLAILVFIGIALTVIGRRLVTTLNGPLRKITADLLRAAAGDLTIRTMLRRDDPFQETAADINNTIKAMNTYYHAVAAKLTEVDRAVAQGDTDRLRTEIHELQTISRTFTP